MEPSPVRREQLSIKSYEVDSTGTLKLYALMNHFQEIAGIHATELGWGYESLEKRKVFWVLSRIKIYVSRLPAWREGVTLETWPVGVDKLFAVRDFRMTDGDRNNLLTAVSAWLLLERESYRPQKVGMITDPIFQRGVQGNIHETPGKIGQGGELELRYEKKVLPSDLDVNNHVNNAEYVKWIVDSFDADRARRRVIKTIQVNYLEEAVLGDVVAIYAGKSGSRPDSDYLEGMGRSRGSRIFQSEVIWGDA